MAVGEVGAEVGTLESAQFALLAGDEVVVGNLGEEEVAYFVAAGGRSDVIGFTFVGERVGVKGEDSGFPKGGRRRGDILVRMEGLEVV